MLKCRSDDEKASEKEANFTQFLLELSNSFDNVKNDSKKKKTFSSSALRLLKNKTVEENWIKKS